MKKFLAALGILLLVGALGVGIYFLVMNIDVLLGEEPASDSASSESSTSRPQAALDVRQQARDYSEIQEALDYEITQNRDTVAWLKIEGTDINNSVLQSYDNNFYLRRNERRADDVFGCYFADYECSVGARDVLSPNTIVYGHNDVTNDPNGRRFAQLYRFLDPAFAEATPRIQFCTLEDAMEWQVFAVFYTHTYFNYTDVNITGEELMQIVGTARENSIYDYDVEVTQDDKILTLSTCTVSFGDSEHRFVVMAKLLGSEAELPETASFTERPENRH